MENDYKMKNWNINFGKKNRTQASVGVYTSTMIAVIYFMWIASMSVGIWMLTNEPGSGARWGYMGIAVLLPGYFAYSSVVYPKRKLKEVTKKNLSPATEIDLDRYLIAMEYYGLGDLLPQKMKEQHGLYESEFNRHRRVRPKQRFSMFKLKRKKR